MNRERQTSQLIDSASRTHDLVDVVAVNDNGIKLLEWFRALSAEEQHGVVKVAALAAARLRH